MYGWLLGMVMLAAGVVALVFGALLASWWVGAPVGERSRYDNAPLWAALGLLVPWLLWMLTALILAGVGGTLMLLGIVGWVT